MINSYLKYIFTFWFIACGLNVYSQKEVINWSGLQKYSVDNIAIGKSLCSFHG